MNTRSFQFAICTLLLAVPGLSRADGSEHVAKRTMMNTGNFLVQCQDGSVEGDVTPYQYFSGDVCPTKKKNDIPIKRFLGIMTIGSCATNGFNTVKGFDVEFAEPYLSLTHGKGKSIASCLLVLKYQLPAGLKITYSKVRVDFENSTVSNDSDIRLEMSADGGAKLKSQINKLNGKKTQDYIFDAPSSTPCYKEPNSITRINLHAAIFGDTLNENDTVNIAAVSIPDFKVVKCEH